ncbi:MAG TPA: hypothetical protein VJ256_07090 [Dehalococcoidia bacterium]|nr:hypothetical protein [Dehalococcoidia bacterium]HLB29336.1 hypothetical protein [Dehalococcoidia bacterium]
MAVKVVNKATGETQQGKFALVKSDSVALYSGIMADKKGGWRGCGKRWLFPADGVEVVADNPQQELQTS